VPFHEAPAHFEPWFGGYFGPSTGDLVALTELSQKIEEAILRRSPTVKSLPAIAREAQYEALGVRIGPLWPETLEAANRVFIKLYSDADAREAILAAVPALNSINPREIKRFINLFRFYTFITQQDRLRGVPAPTGPAIAKLAVLAIRWPHLLNLLGGRLSGDTAVTVLSHLEQCADRHTDGRTAPGTTSYERWRQALFEVGLVDSHDLSSSDPSWAEDLRQFLAAGPSIATAANHLLL
jgi:hypothetical protein